MTVDLGSATSLDLSGFVMADFGGASDRVIVNSGTGTDYLITGTSVSDEISGSVNADSLYGGAGDDSLFGGFGVDQLAGGLGADALFGGDGEDTVRYDEAVYGDLAINLTDSLLNSGAAAIGDTYVSIENVVGGVGNDTITGTAQGNRLAGGAANDQIYGGADNDTLTGGAGADALFGGDGTRDEVSYSGSATGLQVDLSNAASNTGEAAGDTFSGIENISGSSYSDTLFGNADENEITGNGGNDLIYGGAENDSIYGAEGSDNLWGGSGADLHNGGADASIDFARYDDANYADLVISLLAPASNTGAAAGDTYIGIEGLVGGVGNDTITGDHLANILLGLSGNDLVYGGDGNDSISGGSGNDLITGGAGADRLSGGDGTDDRASYAGSVIGLRVDLTNSTTNTGEAAGDTFSGIEGLLGSQFNDTLIGDAVGNAIDGGVGADVIEGRNGDDTLDGNDGNDVLVGGAGADVLLGNEGSRDQVQYTDSIAGLRVDLGVSSTSTGIAAGDTFLGIEDIHGSGFDDSLLGDIGANILWGDAGNDLHLDGRQGDDTIYGGSGNDHLIGGNGADSLVGDAGSHDVACYSDSSAGLRVDLQVASTNTGIAAGDTFSGVEDLLGSAFGDSLLGDTGANIISGDAGNDIFLDGRVGNDTIYGGTGNDVLIGGAGADLLDGGTGTRDRVQFTDSTVGLRVDIQVTTFNTGIAVGDVFVGVEDIYGSFSGDTLLGDTANNIIWGEAGSDAWLDGRIGNDTVYGGAGNDVLIGGWGADSLDGGAGNRDRVQYTDSATGIRVDLQVTTFNTGVAAGDSYTGVEDIYGSFQGDTLLGDTGSNIIWGAAGNDQIDGRLGNDTLIGGAGNDTLTGGAGVDVFLFETALAATNQDSITGYSVADDTIQLENAIFTALTATGTLAATAFVTGAAATTAAHRIIYNSSNGQLLYDADGTGAGAAVLFATTSTGLALVAAEFLVV